MDPTILLASAAADMKGLLTAPTSDKINMLEMVQALLTMILPMSVNKDMEAPLDSICASIQSEKDSSAVPDARVLKAEEVVLELVRQCRAAMPR